MIKTMFDYREEIMAIFDDAVDKFEPDEFNVLCKNVMDELKDSYDVDFNEEE